MRWARLHDCPWNASTCAYAAEGGHLKVLQWARHHDCPWDSDTCAFAAEGGHLDLLKWAREQDCPWNLSTCAAAASNGHLEVLRQVLTPVQYPSQPDPFLTLKTSPEPLNTPSSLPYIPPNHPLSHTKR
jgi:hypothetical protein